MNTIDDILSHQVSRGCSRRQRYDAQRLADMQATIRTLNEIITARDITIRELEQECATLRRLYAEAEERCAQWNL